MPSFRVGEREVGDGAPVFVVAELSANHGHQLDVALATIDAAKAAGADAIKIQTYTPDTLTLPFEREPFVVKTKNEWGGKTLHALYKEAMTPWEWTKALKQRAEERGLVFFSTPFDTTAVDHLEAHGAPLYKIASFELVDLPLVEYVARTQKPMILSTGMATFEEIEAAVRTARSVGNDRLALLRCVSSYPATSDDMNLAALEKLRTLGTVIGLSDHTRTNDVAVAAVALGARVVEKHFITDRSLGGPDAFFSLEPKELGELVRAIRSAEAAIGTARFGPTPSERASLQFRRSLFVSADVKAGEPLTCRNVRSVRPANGLPASKLPEVLGCAATSDLIAGTPLEAGHVGLRLRAAPGKIDLQAMTVSDERVATVLLSEVTAAIARAIEDETERRGAVTVIVSVPKSAAESIEALVRAGFYNVSERGERVLCERRVRPY